MIKTNKGAMVGGKVRHNGSDKNILKIYKQHNGKKCLAFDLTQELGFQGKVVGWFKSPIKLTKWKHSPNQNGLIYASGQSVVLVDKDTYMAREKADISGAELLPDTLHPLGGQVLVSSDVNTYNLFLSGFITQTIHNTNIKQLVTTNRQQQYAVLIGSTVYTFDNQRGWNIDNHNTVPTELPPEVTNYTIHKPPASHDSMRCVIIGVVDGVMAVVGNGIFGDNTVEAALLDPDITPSTDITTVTRDDGVYIGVNGKLYMYKLFSTNLEYITDISQYEPFAFDIDKNGNIYTYTDDGFTIKGLDGAIQTQIPIKEFSPQEVMTILADGKNVHVQLNDGKNAYKLQ